LAKEVGDITGMEVVLLETNIEAHPFSVCGHRKGGQGGDAVVLVAVPDNRHVSPQAPRAAPGRNEQEPALIQEDEVGAKFLSLFLYAATCTASSERWLPRRAGWPGAREPGNSTWPHAGSSTHGRDGTGHRILCGSPQRCASASTSRWGSHTPTPRPGESPTGVPEASAQASSDGRAPVWVPDRPARAGGRPSSRPTRWKRRRRVGVPLRTLSTRVRTARRPCGGGAPTFSAFRMVSCNIYRHSCSITLAKSNSSES